MAHSLQLPTWITNSLNTAAKIVNDPTPVKVKGQLRLGIDLGTSDIVSVVLNEKNQPVAVFLEWADVVRDGVVLNFHGAANIVRKQLQALETKLEHTFELVNTSFPPGTDARISVNVLEAAGLEVAEVIDEPSAVANLLALDHAAIVDIGGGTTGIAILKDNRVIYSGDEPTGGRHVTLTIAGSEDITLEEAEQMKINQGKTVWPIVRPVFEKMSDIVRKHIQGYDIESLYLSGGSCTLPGVRDLFQREFPDLQVVLPEHPIFLTPLSIAAYQPGVKK